MHVAAGLICSEGRILIARRPEGSHLAGLWEFPGGKQEPNETLEECLEREIREELGMIIKAGKCIMTVLHEYELKKISLHIFDCLSDPGNPKALECQEIQWVKPVELNSYQFPPPDQKFLEFLVDHPDLLA
ncbi:MAG: 8-oxo-dGTP diphosphatase MutT [Deltaproteobacteria bacterium]|nr:8-oxo-dGTP diphosphatase MutT [Deltaproteobacteria bacterium]